MKEEISSVLKHRSSILWALALFFVIISFFEFTSSDSIDRAVKNLETRLHSRQEVLDTFAKQALDIPKNEFIVFPELPSDMVIYRFCDDTLQSWVNQLPIANDDIDVYPFGYRINYMSSRGVTNTPLAYISQNVGVEQYVSLGSAWYVVKVYKRADVTVISALLIQTDYNTDNEVLKNEVNPNLALSKSLSIVPVTFDESYIVKGKDGAILFSVLKVTPNFIGQTGVVLRWLSVIFIILALFSELQSKRTLKMFYATAFVLIFMRFMAGYLSSVLESDLELFSPTLYADFELFKSLADLLLLNLFVFLIISALFMIRKTINLQYVRASKKVRRRMVFVLALVPLLLIPYIHISLRSLILNSNITLELFKIDEISLYTILVYFSYALLFIALLFTIQMLRAPFASLRKFSFLRLKPMLVYIFIISLYSLIVVSVYGFKKEYNRNKVWTTKMSVERDLNVELQLKSIEQYIASDPLIRMYAESGEEEVLNYYLTEVYTWNLEQRYDRRIRVCRPTSILELDNYSDIVYCQAYYQEELFKYGIPLYDRSRFFFMNNYNGRISYLGVFSYPSFSGELNIFIELESKFIKEAIGYPDILLNHKQIDNLNMPTSYSYAKYLNGRLISYGGRFNYSYSFEDAKEIGYNVVRKDNYVHFVNRVSSESVIVISRPERSIFPYIVSFSYIVLFFSLIMFGLIRIRHKSIFTELPKNSFRRKITFLILASLVFALISMGAGSIWFSLNYFKESNRGQMEEKIQTVQSTLAYFSKYVGNYKDPQFYNNKLFESLTRLSNNAQIDINLYAPNGVMVRTTQKEMFDSYLVGFRMNPYAFKEIVYNHKKQVINQEKIGNLTYYSLYAPLLNKDGKIIAIVNIPYFSRKNDIGAEASNIIATIINIYLLLLLGAVFGGIALSNSLSKPLAEISRKMRIIEVGQSAEHIDYNNKDELGILVAAYNKMVDDLEESTRQLAQSEREQAWREMARQIAHEIKNPLTPMRLSIQHLVRLKQQNIQGWEERFDALANSLIEQIDILSDAASEFSSFSRFYSEDLTKVDVNNLILEQIVLFNTRDNISVNFESEVERDAMILARKTQLARVLVNLLSNAVQALEGQLNGKILVSLTKEEKYYSISIEDNGTGVPENLTHRLFKPNFTTKSGGTGLGLAICRSIIEQSQGSVSYRKSERLGGACFTIRLPFSLE